MAREATAPAEQSDTPETLDVVLHYDVWLEDEIRLRAAPMVLDAKGAVQRNAVGAALRENVKTTLPKKLAARLIKDGKAELYLEE